MFERQKVLQFMQKIYYSRVVCSQTKVLQVAALKLSSVFKNKSISCIGYETKSLVCIYEYFSLMSGQGVRNSYDCFAIFIRRFLRQF